MSPNVVLKSSHSRAYPHWANAAPILPIIFSYPIIRAKLKSLCHVICLWSQQVRALSLVNQSKQSWTLLISGVAASIGYPERCASRGCTTTFKFTHPIVYNHKRWCYEHYPIWLWFLLVLNLSYVDVWSLHETRFFCKKYKGCSL